MQETIGATKEGVVEVITTPAVKCLNGRIFTGKNHESITGEITEEDMSLLVGRKYGFMTNTGKFVSREEAGQIAFLAGQTKTHSGSLSSEDLK